MPLDSTPVLIGAGQIAERGVAAAALAPPELIKIAAIRAAKGVDFPRLRGGRRFVRGMSGFARPMSSFARNMSGSVASLHTDPVHLCFPD